MTKSFRLGIGLFIGSLAIPALLRAAPVNDQFTDRVPISGLVATVAGDNIGASKEPGEPNHFGNPGGKSVWWSWTPAADGLVALDTIGSSFDTLLAVYVGGQVTNLTPIASDDDSGGNLQSRVTFIGVAGTTYQIAVDGYYNRAVTREGNIVLNLQSEQPANDHFTNAFVLVGATNFVTGHNLGATREAGEPNHHGGGGGKSVWWTWTPETSGMVTVTTVGSGFDTLLAVYIGDDVANLTEVVSDDDNGGGLTSAVTFAGIANTTYRIAVDGYSSSSSGLISLYLQAGLSLAAPPNDHFTNAIAFFGLTNAVAGYNVGATKEVGEPDHAGYPGGASVWWTWMAPTNGIFHLDTGGSSFNTTLAVYRGTSVSNLILIASNDDDFNFGDSRLTFEATADTSYYMVVDTQSGAVGSVNLHFAYVGQRPSNDDFANATVVSASSNELAGTTFFATYETEELFAFRPSVWWRFVAPANGTVMLQKEIRFFPTFDVYTGDVLTNLTRIGGTQVSTTERCTFSFEVAGGGSYPIRVTSQFPIAFNFALRFQPGPTNDAFAARTILAPDVQRVTGTTAGTTRELNEPEHGNNSVWWSWTAPRSGPVILTSTDTKFDTTLLVYTGNTLTNLSLVASNDTAYAWNGTNGPAADPASRLRFDAVAGTTYQIAITGGSGDVTLNFEYLAIESIPSLTRTLQSDRSVDFSATLELSSLRAVTSGPVRVRLVARPWFITRDGLFLQCPDEWPVFAAPDVALGIFPLGGGDVLSPATTIPLLINGTVPPPYEENPNTSSSGYGYGYGVLAFLEEQVGGFWIPQDTRMIVLGDWAVVNGFGGPGGGVISITPSQSSKSGSGYLQVHIEPAAARQAGAGWRLQGEATFRTDPNSTAFVTTNGSIVVEFAPVPGWSLLASQNLTIPLEALTGITVNYAVQPPLLTINPAQGLVLAGTTNTSYRLEYRTNLNSGVWLPLATNHLTSGSTSLLPLPPTNHLPAAFYRAVWLP